MPLLQVRKGTGAGKVFAVLRSSTPTVLGREGHADVALDDPKASRRHASLGLCEGQWVLQDLGSSNGTFVQGARIGQTVLEGAATFQIGGTLLSFLPEELPPLPAGEVQGVQPLEGIHEASGVYCFRGRQSALDREVRCDWIIPSRPLTSSHLNELLLALEEARRLEDAGFIPVLGGQATPDSACVLLRGCLPALSGLKDQLLAKPLEARLSFVRDLFDLALERATWEHLRAPMGLQHVCVVTDPATGAMSPALPALEVTTYLAGLRGDLRHLPELAHYLPPELAEGVPVEEGLPFASTMYNLGALAYEILTRSPAMGSGPTAQILKAHRALRPAPAALVEAEIPEAASSALERLLEKDPRARPRGRQEILGAFAAPAAAGAVPNQVLTQAPGAGVRAPDRPPPRPGPSAARPPANRPTPGTRAPRAREAVAPAPSASRPPAPESSAPSKPSPRTAARRRLPLALELPLWGLCAALGFQGARILTRLVCEALAP